MSSSLACGILGLPNVGKSTLFNALTRGRAPVANYPFCTIEPNLGLVEIPDPRVDQLAMLNQSRSVKPATMRFWDIAGLVKGASQGEGLGNQFLGHIRQVDALIHVVRCFADEDVVHTSAEIDALGDIDLIETELLLADLQVIERALERRAKQRGGQEIETKALLKLRDHLNHGPARLAPLEADERLAVEPYNLLTFKPIIYVANVNESDLAEPAHNPQVKALMGRAQAQQAPVLALCADLEAQISQLDPKDRLEMLTAVGLEASGLERLIQASFETLGLIAYLTTGEPETRAWPITRGTTAPQAAGKIHSDLERGFIRAEVISYGDYIRLGGRQGAKEAGLLRIEGRDYLVQDGDVVLFLHR